MSGAYFFYNLAAGLAAPLAVGGAVAKGRLAGRWRERLGLIDPPEGPAPRIWVHAVSVGETEVAAAFIRALVKKKPSATVWLSTTTQTGRAAALERLPQGTDLITFPLDVYGSPHRALSRLQPDLIVILETELWPNFLKAAKTLGARTMLANGRISVRSFGRYQKIRFFIRQVLDDFDLIATIGIEDRKRMEALGAPKDRIRTVGNAKFDLLLEKKDEKRVALLKKKLALDQRPVLVAGSTRPKEEGQILSAFQRLKQEFPDLHLILAPRHIQRIGEIQALVRTTGLGFRRLSRITTKSSGPEDVTLVDVMGELFSLYGLATVAFIGASLVPLGGQNPLEPAAWGVPVLFGPHMEDFPEPVRLLTSAGAGQIVNDGAHLFQAARDILRAPDSGKALGESGLEALQSHQGAADRLADLALELV